MKLTITQRFLCVAGPHVVAPKSPPVVFWFVIGWYPNSRLPWTNSRPTHNLAGEKRHYTKSCNTQEPLWVGTFNKENVNEYYSCKIPFTALVTNTTTLDISISDKHTKHNNLTSTSYTCIECLPKLCLATASTTNFLAQSWRTPTGQTLIIWPHTKLPPRNFQ